MWCLSISDIQDYIHSALLDDVDPTSKDWLVGQAKWLLL
jgi:hypothetical protein